MDTIADYAAWRNKRQEQAVGAAQNVLSTVEQKPDELAGDLKLANDFAKETGNPVPPAPVVSEYRNVFQEAVERERNRKILSTAPITTDWLRDPVNAGLTRDTLEGLTWWETVFGAAKNAGSRGIQRVPQSYNQWMANEAAARAQDERKGFGELLSEQTEFKNAQGEVIGRKLMPAPDDLFWAGSRYLSSRLGGLFGDQEAGAAQFQSRAGEIAKRIASIPMSPAGERYKQAFGALKPSGDVATDIGQFFSSVAADPAGFTTFLAETAAESAPSIAVATAATALTRNVTAGATLLGAQSGAIEAGVAPVEFFKEQGVDVSTPEGALAAVTNPELMRAAAERGVTRGVIIGIMDGLSGGIAGKQLAQSNIGNLALQSVVQAVFGSAGEGAAQVASGQEFNVAEVLIEGLAEMVTAPVEVAGVGGRAFLDGRRKARDAETRREIFAELSGQAVGSKLRERMPEKFREFVERATANGPVENVYVPAEQFSTYFQGIGVDPLALIDELDGVTRDDFEAAIAGGGDLQIPTATYAAKIAGSEHDAFLMENMRFDPNEMTAAEAAEFNARSAEVLEEAWQEAEEARLEAEERRSFETVVYDDMVSRLRQAGRSTEVATTEAMLYVASVRTAAADEGMTIDQYLSAYPLPEVRGTIPEGMQFRDVDALTRTLATARAQRQAGIAKRGPSLLEFIAERGGITDVGGELRARDAEVVKRGRKNLRVARKGGVSGAVRGLFGGSGDAVGYGPDDVARAAIEAGYLRDDPLANEYRAALESGAQVPEISRALYAAIDRELAGEVQYRDDAPVDQTIDEIEAYLAGLNVSLDDDDMAIRQAVEADQAGRRYAQVTPDQARAIDMTVELPDTAEFKRAVENTEGAEITADGLLIDLVRFQKPEQEGATSVRTGVFYLPAGSKDARHYKTGGQPGQWYGGTVKVSGQTLLKRPLFVKGATGGKAPEAAYDAIKGKGAAKKLNEAARSAALTMPSSIREEVVERFLSENGADGSMAWEIMQNSRLGNQLTYALQENVIAHAVREAGYDAVIGYGVGRGDKGAFISEVFDVREIDYPVPGAPAVLHPDFEPRRYAQAMPATKADVEEFEAQLRAELGLRSLSMFLTNAGDLKLNMIAVNKDAQGRGTGSEAMRRIVGFADERGLRLTLTTGERDDGFGTTSRARLISFYKRFGFVENKGRKKDFSISESMYRDPATARRYEQSAEYPIAPRSEWYGEANYEGQGGRLIEMTPDEYLASVRPLSIDDESRENIDLLKEHIQSGKTLDPLKIFDGGKEDGRHRAYAAKELGIARVPVVVFGDQVERFSGAQYFQDQGSARGSITAMPDGRTIIDLFQSANLSTVLHETGHYWLLNLQARADAGSMVAAERLQSVRAWWLENADAVARDAKRAAPGVEVAGTDVAAFLSAGTTGDRAKDLAIDVGMQEQFARAAEAYLMEGKAPTAELRSMFEKFRAWLISIYGQVSGLNVQMSDDMRRVFDRMLASDEEIAKAQGEVGGDRPLFTSAESMGLTDAEYSAFLKLREQAEDESKARLLREVMAPIAREREEWFKTERAKVREEVERQVNAYPYFRALEWMGNRRWLGEDQPQGMRDVRMSKDILVERYGAGVLKTLPRGMQTLYAVEGGADPDDIAGWFGFDSGDQMIQALERAPRRVEAIEAETDKVMLERHGDVMRDGTVEAQALDAVHTDKRGQWIAAELKAIAEVAGVDVAMTQREARETARQTLNRTRVRDAMNANRFLAAERKAGEEAARLGAMLAREGIWMRNARNRIAGKARAAVRGDGTVDAVAPQIERANASTGNYNETAERLITAKRRQLLNHALYMEARKIADEVEKAENYVGRLNKKTTREKIGGAGRRDNAQVDYLAAIDDILARFDFRRLSRTQEERRGALAAYIEAMTAAGRENELAIPDHVLSAAGMKPYKTITVEELRGVVDSLKNIEHVALRWNKLIDGQRERELGAAVDEIAAAFEENVPKKPPGRVGTRAENLRNAGRQYLDLVLNAGTLLREIDGFTDLGAAYRNIKTPIDEAMIRLTDRKDKAATDLAGLYEVYSKEERRGMNVRRHIPALGYALSKWEILSVALNTGNDGNFQRLTDTKVRGHLTEPQVSAVLATLDERDARFVQSVWDYLETFRADIAARERRTTGVEPKWVEARPVTIAGVALRGGYYPIKYDARLSSLARDDAANDIATSLQAGRFGKAQTRNGHLKERAQSSGRDIELDLGVLHRHVNQVVYDLELSEPVANAWRILQSSEIRQAFIDSGKSADFDALEVWLKDVAEGEIRSASFVGRGARTLKSNFTAAKLAFNVGSMIVQVTGLTQTAVVTGKGNMLRGIQDSLRPGVHGEVAAKSSFMRTRQTTFNKDIYDFYNDPRMGPIASRWGEIKKDVIGPLAFYGMTKIQWWLVDVPTWLAGYRQGLERFGNDEAQAIAHADAVVKRAQASGMFPDRSAVERGSVDARARQNDVVRLFTTLASYMFAKFNVAYERTKVAQRVVRDEGVSRRSAGEVLGWTLDMAMLFTFEALLTALIKGQLPDEDEDESWLKFLGKETAFGIIGTLPFIRDVASPLEGFAGGGAYGSITEEAARPITQMIQGELDAALVKSIVAAGGLTTGLPSAQINRAVDAAFREAEGQDVAPWEYLLGRMGN